MEVRPGYKQTEVGVIPEGWDVKPLGEIGEALIGLTYKPAEVRDHGTLVLRSSNIQNDALSFNNNVFVDADIPERIMARPGDVLICVRNGSRDLIGKSALLDERTKGMTFGAFMAVYRSPIGKLASYLFQSAVLKRQINEHLGATINQITNKSINSFRVPIPPSVPEQRAITAALSDVDALLSGLKRLIAKKRDIKQAAMQQLLTGKTRLHGFGPTRGFKQHAYGDIPDDWSVKQFKKISVMNGRIGWQGLKQDEFTENPDDPYLITGMNFKDGKIRWDEVYHIPGKRYNEAPAIQLKVGDVLMTKDGTIGKLLFVDEIPHPGMASLNSHLLVFRPVDRQYVPKFLFYQLGSPSFAQHIELHKSGSTFFGITQGATGKYPVILPSVAEQEAIAAVLSDMDAELSALVTRREKTRALKQAMMQELLTGNTRLISPEVAHA